MSTLTSTKLSSSVGAEVHDVDVDRLGHDEDLPGATLDALEVHGVLVFPRLGADDAAQVAFSRKLGSVVTFGKGELPEIFRVTLDPAKNPMAGYLRGTFDWHIDGMTDDVPIMATILSAHAVADQGGETEFASTYAAYDALSPDEKQGFEKVRVRHTFEHAQRLVIPDPTPEELALWRRRPSKVHPLIWTHRSGRKSLVLGATADTVEHMGLEQGRELLDRLLARATAPYRVYRHRWRRGDMVIWDNRGVLHRALPYDPGSARDMHRTTLHGDEPVR
jgi:alpha-ketoglutarate-dependent taurine dioxygenase